jgi:hypothetical protein
MRITETYQPLARACTSRCLVSVCAVLIGVVFFLCRHDPVGPASSLPDLPTTLPQPIAPITPFAPIVTVGNGSAAGITESMLRAAIDSLDSGGTVLIVSGVEPIQITLSAPLRPRTRVKPLLIDGNATLTLSGADACRVFDGAHYTRLILQRMTITGGRTDSSGAAVYLPWFGELTCIGVNFVDNQCTTRGPEFGGGAIFAGGLGFALISGCQFVNCKASNGGAILNRSSNLSVIGCLFLGDTAFGEGGGRDAGATGMGGLGGAVYVDGVNHDSAKALTIATTAFRRCLSRTHGGALWVANNTVSVQNCTFAENRADYGPAIYSERADNVRLWNSLLVDNQGISAFSALSCTQTFVDGGGNIQWPETKTSGNSDLPCSKGILFADPGLSPPAGDAGYMAIDSTGPAASFCHDCPEVDQRGAARKEPCDAGAYEVP